MGAAEDAKNEGNTALNEGRLDDAIACYTTAIELAPENHVFHSNRSAANTRAKKYDAAVSDAARCIVLKPDWARGYSRHGYALYSLARYEDAATAYRKGLEIDSGDQSMCDGLKKAQQMASISAAAEKSGAAMPKGSPSSEAEAANATDGADAPARPRVKPDIDKRRLGLVVFLAMVLGQVAYYAVGRKCTCFLHHCLICLRDLETDRFVFSGGVPMLYTMGFVMLAFQLGFVPVLPIAI